MADQKVNELPAKAAPVTGDKMLVVGAAEESLIDYDQLADAILNKLTSKTFTLDQGTKTLLAALNELNSKFPFYGNVYSAPCHISDIDTFNGIGDAFSDSTSGTLPQTGGNRWLVLSYISAGKEYGMQLAITFSNNSVYIRNKQYSSDGSSPWNKWRII